MRKRIVALAKPELLVWARNSAGLSIEEAAKKVGVKPERLQQWETGEKQPTINQLRKLGKAYRRPMAVFFLPEPPRDFQPLRDFRRLVADMPVAQSPQLRVEIRRAWNRRDLALQLYEQLGEQPPQFSYSVSISDDPDELAGRIRHTLGMSYDKQTQFRTPYEALNWWRSALESLGVLVFQATGVQVSEMRGFSISETPLPAIIANSKDAPLARIFTLLHELVHIMCGDGALCDLDDSFDTHNADQEVEVFCNRVAGAILVPRKDLLSERIISGKTGERDWLDEEIEELANKYKVSREVLVRRMLICDLTTQEFYREKRAQFRVRKPPPRGGPPPYRKAIATAGSLFIRLVFANYYQENITASDLSDFLDVKLKHMKDIESQVFGRSIEFGVQG